MHLSDKIKALFGAGVIGEAIVPIIVAAVILAIIATVIWHATNFIGALSPWVRKKLNADTKAAATIYGLITFLILIVSIFWIMY